MQHDPNKHFAEVIDLQMRFVIEPIDMAQSSPPPGGAGVPSYEHQPTCSLLDVFAEPPLCDCRAMSIEARG